MSFWPLAYNRFITKYFRILFRMWAEAHRVNVYATDNWKFLVLFTVRNGKVMFSQACVKNSVHGGRGEGVCLWVQGDSVCLWVWGGCIPQADTPWADIPPGRHPLGRQPPEADGPRQTSPLRQTPPTTATGADGTHLTGMHSCFRIST